MYSVPKYFQNIATYMANIHYTTAFKLIPAVEGIEGRKKLALNCEKKIYRAFP